MTKLNRKIDYFTVGPGTKGDRVIGTKVTVKMHELSEVFTKIGCFKDTFSSEV